ncbi:fucose isomerase [Bifidobacterium primatium]|uniref:Fucose isomerase n=1 Tax=Bifidobacterium primatium TaxID=2045438 RepID=A0A2M9H6J1_9BIFI|nr:RbsD/FucU domain-containing protein [Bifidobacterium primatium]PJM72442.1 fucose isomerase [Bifidobacterium primatium]
MLKGIPPLLSPELLKALDEMGHGDELVIADGNFPAESIGSSEGHTVIRCDGHGALEVLEAVLAVLPIDTYDDEPITLMEVVPGDPVETPIWQQYHDAVRRYDARGEKAFKTLERFAFYEAAKRAHCVIATSESAQYANLLIRKGCVLGDDVWTPER